MFAHQCTIKNMLIQGQHPADILLALINLYIAEVKQKGDVPTLRQVPLPYLELAELLRAVLVRKEEDKDRKLTLVLNRLKTFFRDHPLDVNDKITHILSAFLSFYPNLLVTLECGPTSLSLNQLLKEARCIDPWQETVEQELKEYGDKIKETMGLAHNTEANELSWMHTDLSAPFKKRVFKAHKYDLPAVATVLVRENYFSSTFLKQIDNLNVLSPGIFLSAELDEYCDTCIQFAKNILGDKKSSLGHKLKVLPLFSKFKHRLREDDFKFYIETALQLLNEFDDFCRSLDGKRIVDAKEILKAHHVDEFIWENLCTSFTELGVLIPKDYRYTLVNQITIQLKAHAHAPVIEGDEDWTPEDTTTLLALLSATPDFISADGYKNVIAELLEDLRQPDHVAITVLTALIGLFHHIQHEDDCLLVLNAFIDWISETNPYGNPWIKRCFDELLKNRLSIYVCDRQVVERLSQAIYKKIIQMTLDFNEDRFMLLQYLFQFTTNVTSEQQEKLFPIFLDDLARSEYQNAQQQNKKIKFISEISLWWQPLARIKLLDEFLNRLPDINNNSDGSKFHIDIPQAFETFCMAYRLLINALPTEQRIRPLDDLLTLLRDPTTSAQTLQNVLLLMSKLLPESIPSEFLPKVIAAILDQLKNPNGVFHAFIACAAFVNYLSPGEKISVRKNFFVWQHTSKFKLIPTLVAFFSKEELSLAAESLLRFVRHDGVAKTILDLFPVVSAHVNAEIFNKLIAKSEDFVEAAYVLGLLQHAQLLNTEQLHRLMLASVRFFRDPSNFVFNRLKPFIQRLNYSVRVELIARVSQRKDLSNKTLLCYLYDYNRQEVENKFNTQHLRLYGYPKDIAEMVVSYAQERSLSPACN